MSTELDQRVEILRARIREAKNLAEAAEEEFLRLHDLHKQAQIRRQDTFDAWIDATKEMVAACDGAPVLW
jgi:hypothetical protein